MDSIEVLEQLRAQMNERQGAGVYECMSTSKVAIAGLGGLGSNIAVMLARIGVGELLLVDYDVVEPSNLNRQNYQVGQIGLPKTEALKVQLVAINPFIKVLTMRLRVTEENAVSLFKEYPVVCEAFDEAAEKAMLINKLLTELPEIKIVSGSGMAGLYPANLIQTKQRVKNLYVCGDGEHEYTKEDGIMAPRVMICAAHEANMIVNLLMKNAQEDDYGR